MRFGEGDFALLKFPGTSIDHNTVETIASHLDIPDYSVRNHKKVMGLCHNLRRV